MPELADLPTFTVRPARTADVPVIARIVAGFADNRRLLHKEKVTYYESVQEFRVAVDSSDQVIGCGALHVLWEDLAEVRTLAVDDPALGIAGGRHVLLEELLAQGERLGVSRLFCLTFESEFLRPARFSRDRGHAGPAGDLRRVAARPVTREWPSSSTWPGSSRTLWATPGCCANSEFADPDPMVDGGHRRAINSVRSGSVRVRWRIPVRAATSATTWAGGVPPGAKLSRWRSPPASTPINSVPGMSSSR